MSASGVNVPFNAGFKPVTSEQTDTVSTLSKLMDSDRSGFIKNAYISKMIKSEIAKLLWTNKTNIYFKPSFTSMLSSLQEEYRDYPVLGYEQYIGDSD